MGDTGKRMGGGRDRLGLCRLQRAIGVPPQQQPRDADSGAGAVRCETMERTCSVGAVTTEGAAWTSLYGYSS
jgi:hypothetical protein